MDNKYSTPDNESEQEVLPNKLGITTIEEINKEEARGFAKASLVLTHELTDETVFDLKYILKIHTLAFDHLYEFAGSYRTVNMSKGGFTFPASMYLEQSMNDFDKSILAKLESKYLDKKSFIKALGETHAELLFIHPFREGNGRTARLFANMMAYKNGYERLKFEKLKPRFKEYIHAVQQAGIGNYNYMIELMEELF